MIINNSVLSGNYAYCDGGGDGEGGGAIENFFGSLTINGGALSGNTSDDQGGAIFNRFGSLTVSGGCTLSGNTALAINGSENFLGDGGGISNIGGTVTISDSTLSSNTATQTYTTAEGNGGAIATFGGSLRMTNCTVDHNTAPHDGGGIFHNGGTVILNTLAGDSNPSILSNNSAKNGGAYATLGGSVTLSGWTLSGNTGYVDGGGMFVDPAVVTVISCVFSGNTAPAGADLYNLDSTVTLIGSSISGITSNGGTVTDPLADLIAQVGTLSLNSGQQNSLTSTLQAAQKSLTRANDTAAVNQLDAFTNQLNALVNSHRLGELTADSLVTEVDNLVELIGQP